MFKKKAFYCLILCMLLLCVNVFADTNMLKNSEFTSGLFPWTAYVDSTAQASVTATNGEAKATISNGGTETWMVSLSYGSLKIEKGKMYTVTFDARADQPRTLPVYVGMNKEPYDVYSNYDIFNLTTSMQTYTFTFQMIDETDVNAVLGIEFGKNNVTAYVDNVYLTTPGPEPTPTMTPVAEYVNIAKGRPVGVSSNYSSAYPKENLVDGNKSTVWGSSTAASAQWMYVDLGSVVEIDGIGIYWYSQYYASKYDIYVSNDAQNWTHGGSFTKTNGDPDVMYATATGRYIGILFSAKNSVAVGVSEFEVYDVQYSQTPTPTATIPPTPTPVGVSWDMQCHSYTHAHLDQISASAIRNEFENVNDAFAAQGLPLPEHHAYPYGGQNATVRQITAEYRLSGRLAWGDIMEIQYPVPDWYQLKTVEVQGTTQWSEVKQWIDNCIMVDGLMQIFTHAVVEGSPGKYQMSKQLLIQTLDYLKQKQDAGQLKVLGLNDAYHEWNGTKAVVNFAFDDGFTSDYTIAYPLFKARNLIGTSYIVPNAVGSGQYMSWNQIHTMIKGE